MKRASSSRKQIQIEFTPSILASELISVSDDSFTLFIFPKEILLKIGEFASVETMRNLIATCKYIRNRLDAWFLQLLVSENNPDRATSGFIIDSIGNKGDTCLWRNVEFFIKDHDIPKELSIHLFANTTAKKISSDEVRSMIIQVSEQYNLFELPDSHRDFRKFIEFLFPNVSFKNLRCLMVCGVELSTEFSQEIGALNLDVFYMRNFRYHTSCGHNNKFFNYFNSLKTLYVVHPNKNGYVCPPKELKKLVIYCPKSSKDIIDKPGVLYCGLHISVEKCHALKEM